MKRVIILGLILLLIFGVTYSAIAGKNKASGFRIEKGVRVSPGVSSDTIRMPDGSYRMYYTGMGIMVAESANGKNFSNNRPVLSLEQVQAVFSDLTQISNSAIIKLSNGSWRMIFEGRSGLSNDAPRRLYSATSADGLTNWTVEAGVRLEDGEGTSIFTSVPEIIGLSGGRLRIYYATGLKTKSAVSSDEGLTWSKEGFISLNKKMRTLVDADVTKIGKKYVLLFSDMPNVPGKKGKGKGNGKSSKKYQRIYRAYSKDSRRFKFSGMVISLKAANAMDPDMAPIGRGRLRIYFSRMKPNQMSSDILSALYR